MIYQNYIVLNILSSILSGMDASRWKLREYQSFLKLIYRAIQLLWGLNSCHSLCRDKCFDLGFTDKLRGLLTWKVFWQKQWRKKHAILAEIIAWIRIRTRSGATVLIAEEAGWRCVYLYAWMPKWITSLNSSTHESGSMKWVSRWSAAQTFWD